MGSPQKLPPRKKSIGAVQTRPYEAGDAVSEITALLHQAYQPLAEQGLRFVATWQDDEITVRRLQRGTGYIAVFDGAIVGSITYYNVAATSGCPWYDRGDVCSFGQFAVCPAWQGCGLGTRLLRHVEHEAAQASAAEIALDTAETATGLIQFYERRGYRQVGHADWESTNYRSVIMSKPLNSESKAP